MARYNAQATEKKWQAFCDENKVFATQTRGNAEKYYVLEMFPCLKNVNVLRQWAGLCDMTPDYAPILGKVDGLEGFVLSSGWGSWGFKAAPVAGKNLAELVATGETPPLIKPFSLSRFLEGKLVNERAAAPAAAIH